MLVKLFLRFQLRMHLDMLLVRFAIKSERFKIFSTIKADIIVELIKHDVEASFETWLKSINRGRLRYEVKTWQSK